MDPCGTRHVTYSGRDYFFTLSNLHSTFLTVIMALNYITLIRYPLINVYTAWRKCMRVIFCLPHTTHNYIISHLDYNIMERLDRRLVKFIYTILHTNNSTVQSTVNSKLFDPNSVSVCNIVREVCQPRDNLYSCDIYVDMTYATAMLIEVCTE